MVIVFDVIKSIKNGCHLARWLKFGKWDVKCEKQNHINRTGIYTNVNRQGENKSQKLKDEWRLFVLRNYNNKLCDVSKKDKRKY